MKRILIVIIILLLVFGFTVNFYNTKEEKSEIVENISISNEVKREYKEGNSQWMYMRDLKNDVLIFPRDLTKTLNENDGIYIGDEKKNQYI